MLIQSRCPLYKSASGAENAGVGVSQWAADAIGIWQVQGGLTKQTKTNDVRERLCDISLSMSIGNKLRIGPKQYDVLINLCITWLSNLLLRGV